MNSDVSMIFSSFNSVNANGRSEKFYVNPGAFGAVQQSTSISSPSAPLDKSNHCVSTVFFDLLVSDNLKSPQGWLL